MKLRRAWLLLLLPALLGAIWFAPLSREERELAARKREGKWHLCEYRRESEKTNVLRLYTRLGPAYWVWEYFRDPYRVNKPFRFRVVRTDSTVAYEPYYWDDVWATTPKFRHWLSMPAWESWASQVEDLLDWELARPTEASRKARGAYYFLAQTAVRRTGAHELTLLLDPGPFEPVTAELDRMAATWNHGPWRLKIAWAKGDPRAYRLVLDRTSLHNHVDHRAREIHLSDLMTNGTFAHELGHVLGFEDHYDDYLDERSCKVLHRFYWHDIMSDSAYHYVLPGHWRLLDHAYPRNGKAPGGFRYTMGDVYAYESEDAGEVGKPSRHGKLR